jgi:uncharacterized membrane protein YfcA
VIIFFFLFGLLFDTLWVLCIHFVSNRKRRGFRHFAMLTSVLLAALSAYTGAQIARDLSLIIPEILGISVGTYLGLYVADRIDEKHVEDV